MVDYYKGQEFYFNRKNGRGKVYMKLVKIEGDILYFISEYGSKYYCHKYTINKNVFVSLLREDEKKQKATQKPDDNGAIRVKAKKGDWRSPDFSRRLNTYWKNIDKSGIQKDE